MGYLPFYTDRQTYELRTEIIWGLTAFLLAQVSYPQNGTNLIFFAGDAV